MVIPIPTTERKYFRMALEILKVIPPLNTLRPRELDVLSEFLYWNYHYRNLEQEVRNKVIFDYETKLAMREHISMDEPQFNNCLLSIRKKGILTKRGIETNYGISPNLPEIVFRFKINE